MPASPLVLATEPAIPLILATEPASPLILATEPDSDSLKDLLKKVGLTPHDSHVYVYAVSHPNCTVEQVASALGRTASAVLQAQTRLIGLGLVYAEPVGWFKLIPAGPTLLSDQIRGSIEAEYTKDRTNLAQFSADLAKLKNQHLATRSLWAIPQVERLPCPPTGNQRVADLLLGAHVQIERIVVCAAHAPGGLPLPVMTAIERRAAQRGMIVRAIYPAHRLADDSGRRCLQRSVADGTQIRAVAKPPLSLLLLDRAIAIIDKPDDGSGWPSSIVMRGQDLLSPLCALFDICWAYASDVSAEAKPDTAGGLNSDDHLLLNLMGEGWKDEHASRQLGMSVRTLRRRLGRIMDDLGAVSRFQAGVLAGRRGWV
jgi:hypothetical protein